MSQETQEKTFNVSGTACLELSNIRGSVDIRSGDDGLIQITAIKHTDSGDAGNTVWFAPAGTTTFAEGATMTKAAGTATSIAVPTTAGTYKLFVVDAQGKKLGESSALLRVGA